MQTHQHHYSMRALCTALRVSRSGYYAWCARDKLPCALNVAIECQFKQDKARTGAPGVSVQEGQKGGQCLRCQGVLHQSAR